MDRNFFIGENDFRVWLSEVAFIEKSEDSHNSRKISGIMSTSRKDRQGEIVKADGLDFDEFLSHGHFNDNHSQATSAIVGYPEKANYHASLHEWNPKLKGIPGWTCEGYILKGTSRADAIWELAKALSTVPDRKLGFSIEGKVIRREDKTIEKARIRNVAITNCPVNTDCSWEVLNKSFSEPDVAEKSMAAGYGVSPATQSGGGALRTESLDSKAKKVMDEENKRKKAMKKALEDALRFNDLLKSMEFVLERRPDFSDEIAALLVSKLFIKKEAT
ncbi:hypothetical protein EBR03_08615 [bacterium]|nr:hypothetical protein [bacterium]